MPQRAHLATALLTLLALTSCGDTDTPQAGGSDESGAARTLEQMLEVAERGDWGAYVDRFYGEQHEFASPSDRDALVKRFEEGWGTKLLPALQRAAQLTPRIDGDQAIFEDADGPVFVLHRTDDGGWSFHL